MIYYLTELVEEEGFRLCESYQNIERIKLLGVAIGSVVHEETLPCAVSDTVLRRVHGKMIDYFNKTYANEENSLLDLTRFSKSAQLEGAIQPTS